MQLNVVKPGHKLMTPTDAVRALLPLCEAAGRVCYKSEDKTKEGSDARFISGIIRSGHESVIEHGSITVVITCSRSCSHQLVRHRIAAYSQESQRYCDYGEPGLKVICPPTIAEIREGLYERRRYGPKNDLRGWHRRVEAGWKRLMVLLDPEEFARVNLWLDTVSKCHDNYMVLRRAGVPPEDARSVLPNATKTEVVTTFNLRQWRHVFEHRGLNPRAQWQIRRIMQGILHEFAGLLPAVFADQVEHLRKMERN